jgi:hypothetical protein
MFVKPIGNTINSSTSTGNVVSSSYGNGSVTVWALNGSNAVATVTVGSNSSVNTATLPIPAGQAVIIAKLATDLLYASNNLVSFTPLAKGA